MTAPTTQHRDVLTQAEARAALFSNTADELA